MLCQNCGENEANIRYTQIINGIKKEMALCKKCSHELGVDTIDFNMPINLSSFLGEFLDETENDFLPSFINSQKLICDKCGMSYEEFTNTGKFGCENCYEIFSQKIDPILKNMHGDNRHVGRGLVISNNATNNKSEERKVKSEKSNNESNKEDNKLEELKKNLKIAIQEERYEDAAKIRDEIKKLEK